MGVGRGGVGEGRKEGEFVEGVEEEVGVRIEVMWGKGEG